MAATTVPNSAFGTIFQKDGSPDVPIASLTSITGPSMSQDSIETSNHASADNYRTFLPGLNDGGEVSIEGNFISGNAGQAAMITDHQAGTAATYEVVYPDTSKWSFSGICTALEISSPFDDKISFSATFKVSGKPTFTAAV